jgi:hypothetical protein
MNLIFFSSQNFQESQSWCQLATADLHPFLPPALSSGGGGGGGGCPIDVTAVVAVQHRESPEALSLSSSSISNRLIFTGTKAMGPNLQRYLHV